VSDRKKCKLIGGTAGRRRMHVIKKRKDDEKEVHSKALLLAEAVAAGSCGKAFAAGSSRLFYCSCFDSK
jgi:hypothetical protein